jgi:hypothetical protein
VGVFKKTRQQAAVGWPVHRNPNVRGAATGQHRNLGNRGHRRHLKIQCKLLSPSILRNLNLDERELVRALINFKHNPKFSKHYRYVDLHQMLVKKSVGTLWKF